MENNSDDVASGPFIQENRDYGDEQLDWSTMPLELFDNLTSTLMMDYIKWTNVESCEGIQYFGSNKINEVKWKKIGIVDGQKAICLDPGVAPSFGNCTVYSFGIDYEWSFDESMESYGCKVYSFDPSMNLTRHNHSEGISFYPIGLGVRDELWTHQKNRYNTYNDWEMRTLSSIYDMLSSIHGNDTIIDYLKMDIERGEWRVIPQMMESGILMDRVRQIGMEIHLNADDQTSLQEQLEELKILRRMEVEGGFVRFDSKPNLQSGKVFKRLDNLKGYIAYEMVWYNKKFYKGPINKQDN